MSSPRPLTIGCSRLRTGVVTTCSGPDRGSAASGWASLRSTARRWPEVSDRGDSRSCGRGSQGGESAAAASPEQRAERRGKLLGFARRGGDRKRYLRGGWLREGGDQKR